MKNLMKVCCCVIGLSVLLGCSKQNIKWQEIEPSITAATESISRTTFQNKQFKTSKSLVCESTPYLIEYLQLSDYSNMTLNSIAKISQQVVDSDNKQDVCLVIDHILNITYTYVYDKYNDLIMQDENKFTIIMFKSMLKGINNACNDMEFDNKMKNNKFNALKQMPGVEGR